MADYRCQPIRVLARQLAFSPVEARRHHIERAESLYWEIDPNGSYPIEYVAYRITGVREEPDDPEAESDAILFGAAVQFDLLHLVEDLSATLGDPVEHFESPPLTTEQVAERLGVTTRSVARYRSQGLFARRLRWPNGRLRVAFLPGSIERFVASRPHPAEAAAGFDRMDEPTRHAIIIRARRIRSRAAVSPFRVAQHLASKYSRSVEAIRQLLIHHDQHDPRFAIFRDRTPPLTEKQQRLIHRAHRRGIRPRKLCDRFGKSRDAIYRAINNCRARDLAARDLTCMTSPTFAREDAAEVIIGRAWTLPDPARTPRPVEPAEFEPVDAEAEQMLFVRYNYMKHRAGRIIASLDRYRPAAAELDEAEAWADTAAALKRHLVRLYEPIVDAVASRHLGTAAKRQGEMHRLQQIGRAVLRDAIDAFDPGRGTRFASTLTWTLMRRYAGGSERNRRRPAHRR